MPGDGGRAGAMKRSGLRGAENLADEQESAKERRPRSGLESQATTLVLLAFTGQSIAYLFSVLLARRLEVDGFEAYVVASAAFILMVTVAPLGFEKYALRLLPALVERGDWGRVRGYLGFGLRRMLLASVVTGAVVGLWAWSVRDFPTGTRQTILLTCLFLPVGTLVHYAVEVLSAAGGEVRATAIFRVAVPAIALALMCGQLVLGWEMSGVLAVAFWGVAGALALAALGLSIRRLTPPEIWRTVPIEEPTIWRVEARLFWLYRIALAVLSQAGVIALDWLQPSAAAVGAYAAAMGTASLALVLATATNRAYARRLAILLERRAFEAVIELRRERRRWIVPAIAAFLIFSLVFSRQVLAVFRPEFADEGAPALRLLALATAFSVLFGLAPTYLKYRRHTTATFATVACAAGAQILLLLLLVPRLGATGAAAAYAVSMCGMYATFAAMAHRELGRVRADAAMPTHPNETP